MNNFLRIIASGFATSLATTYWDRRERLHQSRLVESLSVFDPALRHVTASIKRLGFSDHAAAANVLHEVINQGFLLSSLDLFYFSGWATLILIAACWLVRRPAATAAVGGGG
jgi:MFS transporter, DHA2 family, multidrug resistance protein